MSVAVDEGDNVTECGRSKADFKSNAMLFKFSKYLIIPLICDWVDFVDFVYLDSANCNTKFREEFLTFVSSDIFTINSNKRCDNLPALEWILRRKLFIVDLFLSGHCLNAFSNNFLDLSKTVTFNIDLRSTLDVEHALSQLLKIITVSPKVSELSVRSKDVSPTYLLRSIDFHKLTDKLNTIEVIWESKSKEVFPKSGFDIFNAQIESEFQKHITQKYTVYIRIGSEDSASRWIKKLLEYHPNAQTMTLKDCSKPIEFSSLFDMLQTCKILTSFVIEHLRHVLFTYTRRSAYSQFRYGVSLGFYSCNIDGVARVIYTEDSLKRLFEILDFVRTVACERKFEFREFLREHLRLHHPNVKLGIAS